MLSGSLRIEAPDTSHLVFLLADQNELTFDLEIAQSLMRTLCANVAHYINSITPQDISLVVKNTLGDEKGQQLPENHSVPSPFREGREKWELYMATLEAAQKEDITHGSNEVNIYGFRTTIYCQLPGEPEALMHVEVANGYPVGVRPFLSIQVEASFEASR